MEVDFNDPRTSKLSIRHALLGNVTWNLARLRENLKIATSKKEANFYEPPCEKDKEYIEDLETISIAGLPPPFMRRHVRLQRTNEQRSYVGFSASRGAILTKESRPRKPVAITRQLTGHSKVQSSLRGTPR